MTDNEKIVSGFKMWLGQFDDDESKRIKAACTKGYISLHELIDALRKIDVEITKGYLKCQKKLS